MPTIIPKDIKPDGTGDYLTLNSWDAAEAADLVSLDQIRKAVVYSGGNALSGALVMWAGWTCDATRYPWIAAADGHAHVGYWDTSKAYALTASGAPYCVGITKGAHIDGMQIQSTDLQGTIISGGLSPLVMRRCIIRSFGNNATCVMMPNWWGVCSGNVFENCILIAEAANGTPRGIWVNGALEATARNCTIYISRNDAGSGAYVLSAEAGGVLTSQNNYLAIGGNAINVACYYASGGTINKGANDATFNAEATTPALRNIAYSAANFLDVTPGSENLHLTTGSALRGVGANLSATFTDDIDGETRPSLPAPWAIGADEPSNVYDADFSDGSVGGDTTTSSMLYSGDVVEGAEGADSAPLPLGQLLADMVDQGIVSDPVLPAGDYSGLVVDGISFVEQGSEDSYTPGNWVDGGIFGDFFSAPTSGHVYVHSFKIYPTMTKVWARPVMTVTVGRPETRVTV